jgi:hypothetical protein
MKIEEIIAKSIIGKVIRCKDPQKLEVEEVINWFNSFAPTLSIAIKSHIKEEIEKLRLKYEVVPLVTSFELFNKDGEIKRGCIYTETEIGIHNAAIDQAIKVVEGM